MKQEVIEEKETSLLSKVLYFILVFFLSSYIQSIIQIIPIAIYLFFNLDLKSAEKILSDSSKLNEFFNGDCIVTLIILFSTIAIIITTIIWCTKVEKRSLDFMGFKKNNILKNYLIGLLVGFIMFSMVVIIEIITGSLKFNGFNSLSIIPIMIILLFFIGFIIQGASEEILIRGYFFSNIKSQHKTIVAVLISSLTFSLLHIFNSGFNFIPFINILLVGIFFALYYFCFDNLWGACAVHSIWNFAQGNIYGIKVSGINTFYSVFNTTQVEGHDLLNGGIFGAEGGLVTTFVIIASIIILYCYMIKKNKSIFGD